MFLTHTVLMRAADDNAATTEGTGTALLVKGVQAPLDPQDSPRSCWDPLVRKVSEAP